jgi:hypothetical protein
VIAIGDMSGWAREKLYPLANEGIRLTAIGGLDETLLSVVNPGLILSPVVARDFDCMDVAAILNAACFRGMYRAVSERSVHPRMITSEVTALYPDLDFDILQVGANGFNFS